MKFSIITINYNNAEGLERTIKSVTSQDYTDYEYIVIDGGSTDGSADVIQKYADKITFWVSEPDRGIYNAMNKGISHAHGEYLNFMNSGDCLHSTDVLSKLSAESHTEDIIFGAYYNPENNLTKTYPHDAEITCLTLLNDSFNHQATFYKRSLFEKRQYDETYRIQSDSKFNFQSIVQDNCSVVITDLVIADYDYDGISGQNKELVAREWQRLLSEVLPPRVLADYRKMYSEKELPIVALLPQLRETGFIQTLAYKFISFLLLFRRTKGK